MPDVGGAQQGAVALGFALLVGDKVDEAVAVSAALAEAAADGERDTWADRDALGVGGAVGATGARARMQWLLTSATKRTPAGS